MRFVIFRVFLSAVLALALSGCSNSKVGSASRAELHVPYLACAVKVDGELDESCYRQAPLVSDFVIAGEEGRKCPRTRAWLFWDNQHLLFAFDCDDPSIVASLPSANEREVDPQDRIELFLWSGRERDAYYCIEIGAQGAVHDYAARFYRRFDDAWAPSEWQHAAKLRQGGYSVEASLPREALEAMGFTLRAGDLCRAGLFRADFNADHPAAPDWITWVDARTPQPDFHVAGAFGRLTLESPHR